MHYQYRRNADEDIRDLERRFYMGDPTVFERLVIGYVRTNSLSLSFLLQYPESFELLPEDWQNQLRGLTGATALCPTCQIDEHDVCSLTPGCSCCDSTLEVMHTSPSDYFPEDENEDEEEEDEDEEDEEHAAERESGEFWECVSCSEELFASDQNETWALLTAASATITSYKLGRGEENQAMCEDCLNQAGLDLDEAVQEDLPGICEECEETEDECICEED